MKVKIKKVSLNDVRLARIIAQKVQRLLSPQFDYIMEHDPKAEFYLEEGAVCLNRLIFESLETEDSIVVDEESVFLHMDNGMSELLCEPEGFVDILRLTAEDLYVVDANVMEYVEMQRQFCKTEL